MSNKVKFEAKQEEKTDLEYQGCYTPEGYLDFTKFAQSAPFQQGVKKLRAGMERGYTFVLMCAEKPQSPATGLSLLPGICPCKGFVSSICLRRAR